ncbi:MAG: ABC-type nitrate/sulfonate/bicarbonate transport system permease component [Myxococcota bacterium]|jgi:ABC-type nitrate/sulfonate/bicarbonate transport system permease component
MWNPYEVLSAATRTQLGVGAVLAVLAMWAALSGSGAVGSDRLPAPWSVLSAAGQLAWSEGTESITDEAPLPETALAGSLESGEPLDMAQCPAACAELISTAVTDCEVDWSDDAHPEGILWCEGEPPSGQSLLLSATVWSVGRVLVAGILVVLIGVPIGVLMGASARINAAFSPLVDPFRSAPIVAISPILVMWLGIGETMKIVFLMMGAIVYLVPMVRDALQAVPQTYWISARDLGATSAEAIWHSVLPMAMPRIADAIIVSVSIMWTYITVAEYINAEVGLGQLIQNARRFSAMDQVFAGIFVIVALALLTYQGMSLAKRVLFPWEGEE